MRSNNKKRKRRNSLSEVIPLKINSDIVMPPLTIKSNRKRKQSVNKYSVLSNSLPSYVRGKASAPGFDPRASLTMIFGNSRA